MRPTLPRLAIAFAALLAGCAATEGGAKHDKKDEAKHARAVQVARKKLDHARLDAESDGKKHAAAIDQATKELSLADETLQDFQSKEGPLKVRKATLEVKEKEDSLAENQEELQQLELMYAEQDLADKTREMVLARTKRRLEQSQKELALAHDELTHLQEDELAAELGKLQLEVSEKQHAREAAELDARVATSEKALAILEAQSALAAAEAGEDGDESAAAGGGEEEESGDED